MSIHVKAIIGSASSNSYNLKVVEFMRNRYKGQLEITPLPTKNLEMFFIDNEMEVPQNVKTFRKEVREAEAVLFATAEYNYSIPGVLKNALDWLSIDEDLPLKGKPSFIIGSSVGTLGSVRAQMNLREVLLIPNLAPALLPNNEFYMGTVHEKVNESGEITDQATVDFLDLVIQNFIEFYHH